MGPLWGRGRGNPLLHCLCRSSPNSKRFSYNKKYIKLHILTLFYWTSNQKVRWYKDVMLLDQDSHRLMETRGAKSSLILRNVHQSDYGNYTCEADNKFGRGRKLLELSGKPNPALFISEPFGRRRDSFNLTWSIHSSYPVSEHRLSYRKKKVGLPTDLIYWWI